MVNSKTFDLTVNAFGDFVNEVFSGNDETQKAKLRTKLNQFSKISNDETIKMPDGQIVSFQARKRRISDVSVSSTLKIEIIRLQSLNCFKCC